jgi:hypothetical protein
MDKLLTCDLTGSFGLARLPGQQIELRFGPRPDVVTTPNPVVSVLFSAGSLKGEFHFITDQSCLNLFAQELQAVMPGVHEAYS